MVYSTGHDQSAHRQISDRADCPPPGVFIPGRDFRYRSGIQQYRGVVVVDPRGGSASQGPAVLSPARGKFGVRIRRLRLRTKPAAGRFRRADPAFPGGRDLREGQVRRLPPAQSVAELAIFARNNKGALVGRLLCFFEWRGSYFAAGLAPPPPSSFLRCSSAFFCSSSCNFFWFSSNTFGSVGGPS